MDAAWDKSIGVDIRNERFCVWLCHETVEYMGETQIRTIFTVMNDHCGNNILPESVKTAFLKWKINFRNGRNTG
ncbi:MAG: hypothetical protein DWB48_01415 [Nitrosomonas sp.]|nr:hypothetical protein [Nitrosomonas sp.]